MANEKATGGFDDLDDLAFQIFSQSVASHAAKRGGEREAIESYRKAESFLAIRRRVKSGELKPKEPDGPQLADCCAPNLPRTHPHNLVARQFTDRKTGAVIAGDIARVNRIKQWLDRNPTPETNPDELVHRLGREFPDLNWTLVEINTARAIFPAYAKN